MGRHQSYSKRSRESRMAMIDDTAAEDDYPDCCDHLPEIWSPLAQNAGGPPDRTAHRKVQ